MEAKIEIDSDQDLVNRLREAAEKSGEGTSMVSGIEVRAKVNCGNYPLGYVLFRELIDFVREYVCSSNAEWTADGSTKTVTGMATIKQQRIGGPDEPMNRSTMRRAYWSKKGIFRCD